MWSKFVLLINLKNNKIMMKINLEPSNKKKEFINSLTTLSDNELLQKIVENQHYQMEISNKNRQNTSVIVWIIALVIILSVILQIGGILF